MTRTSLTLMIAAAAALAGCSKQDHTIVAGGEPPEENAPVAKGPVQLPPSIAASKIYRCANNQVVYVDWMSDGSARVKKSRDEVGTPVAANAPELKGNAEASAITYNGQSCKG
jgi:hypothetical protein